MSIASKNLYELLGNDPELDPERKTPEVPTKAIDKPAARAGKRNAPAEAPARSAGSSSHRGGQRDGFNANDNAFRDRGVGSDKNRSRGSGEPGENRGSRGDGARGVGRGRGRGRGGSATGDRHSRTGIGEHEKQAGHGWGQQEGNAEWDDEKAGDAIAKADEKDEAIAAQPDEAAEPAAEPEPEDKSKSYAAYLAELAEKKLSFAAENVRKANEGSSKKFPEGKAIIREDEDTYIAGSAGKNKRERERKQKEFVELDDAKLHRETRDTSFRGGRGRGRGEFRGSEGRGRGGRGRGDRGDRGEGRGDRGEGRGRGGRGGQSGPNVSDTSAFPSLGS